MKIDSKFIYFFLQLKAKQQKAEDNQIILPETNWSQAQQQMLELAIVKYPKTVLTDRWVKIANCIPGKTKEECLARYKHLVEIVKAQRARTANSTDATVAVGGDSANKTDDDKFEDKIEIEVADDDEEPVLEIKQQNVHTGKPRNKRKDKKNKMNFSSDEDDKIETDILQEDSGLETKPKSVGGGKPRNKRKDKKNKMNFSSEDDDDDDE